LLFLSPLLWGCGQRGCVVGMSTKFSMRWSNEGGPFRHVAPAAVVLDRNQRIADRGPRSSLQFGGGGVRWGIAAAPMVFATPPPSSQGRRPHLGAGRGELHRLRHPFRPPVALVAVSDPRAASFRNGGARSLRCDGLHHLVLAGGFAGHRHMPIDVTAC
jgi:hypothetical protein